VLVHQAEPADPPAVGQRHALAGVHLPDLVRPLGPAGVGLGPAAARGRRQPLGAEPALQGAGRRRGRGRRPVPQQDADERGAPGGVLASQPQGRRAGGGGRPGPAAVGGEQGVGGVAAQAAHEPAGGAQGQAEAGGDGGRVLAALAGAAQGAADGGGDGTWHKAASTAPQDLERLPSPASLAARAAAAKPSVAIPGQTKRRILRPNRGARDTV